MIARPSRRRRVFLHVGLPKTGTTSLQAILAQQRAAAVGAGVLYPGRDPAVHHRAAVDVHPERYRSWREPGTSGAWDWLVEQVGSWPGTSVISSELLAPASPAEAERALSSLASAEVHVICTARDLARQIPSVWQENIKTRSTTAFADFLTALGAEQLTETSRLFWDYQDLPRVLRTWGQHLPPERVHVVTVPPQGTSTRILWQRFASVLGLDPDEFTTAVPQHNFSLGIAETELLRRLNLALTDGFTWPRYVTIVKEQLVEDILLPLRGPSHIPLPAGDHPWVHQTAQRFIAEIAAAGYHVIGDLTDLLPTPPAKQPATVPSDADVLAAAIRALAEFLQRTPEASHPRDTARRLQRALRELSNEYPHVMALRRIYWRTKARLSRARPGTTRRRA